MCNIKQLTQNPECKTFKIKAEFYVTSTQFKTPEELNKFIREILLSYEGTEYTTYIPPENLQTEFRY